ncbi:hypothetical protein [Pseudoclavibacter sp. AY1H1]|uniref:hypothetical protein n=1 Tax=Pseudoclavibacter sp. AY1H1 TaxID=2080584 RepID=UPI000CE881EF|nr:hypothetical protein [Pseudoclavibacter sp. AY1H1]PPF32616.1 hypothetical protein C5E05_19115 [Pseudoclavibacter sp. AY1H1]
MNDTSTGLSRRSMLLGTLGIGALSAAAQLALPAPAAAAAALPKVAAIASPARSLFAENEQVLARYLMSVAGMANDIVDNDPKLYGFMGGGWWRPVETQSPSNASVMEHVATLAWFYASERPWNPYYRDANLLKRLEASIRYYTSLQLRDGSYPELPGKTNLASTTFGTTAQAVTYEALRKFGVSYDSRLQLRRSIERSVTWFMNTKAAHWSAPVLYFNQVAAGLVAAQRSLQVLDKPTTTQEAVNERISYLMKNGQSPAGFFHEPFGADFGYNFTVTLPDLAWLYRHTAHPDLLAGVQRYADFMSYAVIPEPGTGELTHVPALHVRNVVSTVVRPADDLSDRAALAKDFLPGAPKLALFMPTAEQKRRERSSFAAHTKGITALTKPDTSPRTWMYGILAPEGPSGEARAAAEAELPMLVGSRFTKYAAGSKGDQYLFVRRPSYYAVGVFGEWLKPYRSTRQLGTLWSPTMGTILVGTNNPDSPEGWETVGPNGGFSTRQSSASSRYFDSRTSSGAQALRGEQLVDRATLFAQRTESTAGSAEYVTGWGYWDTGLRYTFITQRAGDCTQRLPLLMKQGDVLTFAGGSTYVFGDADREVVTTSIVLTRGGNSVLFSLGKMPLRVFVKRTNEAAAGGVVHRVGVIFQKQIDLNIAFLADDHAQTLQVEAHRHGNGDISMRVISLPALRGAQLRFAGAAEGAQLAIPNVDDYSVSEQTLKATSSAARASGGSPSDVTVSAVTVAGEVAGQAATTIN